MFKKIVSIILYVVCGYLLYQTIGYIVLGTESPVLYNGEYAYFMGMYLMAITYGVIFLILLSIAIILTLKIKKGKNKIIKIN